MEVAIHKSAEALLNGGRPFDGGIFRAVRERHLLLTLINNGTAAALEAFQTDLPGRVFAGGSIAMITAACVSAAILTIFAFCSFGCAWRTVRREAQSRNGSHVLVSAHRRRQLRRQSSRGRSTSCWLAVLCLLVLMVTLMPMILASAANFRMHHSVAPASRDEQSARPKENGVVDQVTRLLGRAEEFLGGLVGQIRSEVAPVMREAEELTGQLKNRAQAAYEAAFTRSTGAAQLMEASDELLHRMSNFYYSGRNLSAALEQLQAALSDLKNVQFFTYEETCRRYHTDHSGDLCANHTRAALRLRLTVTATKDDWTRANASADGAQSSLEAHAKNITKLVYQLVGTLDGSGNTPERQQELRRQKMSIGDEMNRNISSVFDRELNSTEFLVESVESQLRELQGQLDSARTSVAEMRLRFWGAYTESAGGPEKVRFGLTLGILMSFFICMVALAGGVVPFVLKALKTGSRTRYCVGVLYLLSFLLIAVAILLNTAMYTATAVLQAEVCRYVSDTRSPPNQTKADEFLVPEINDALTELRILAAGDPNATQIPITAIGSLLSALQHSCKENLPMLVAMGAHRYIDEAALDKTAETEAFQAKGLTILRREMQSVNLEQLREEKLEEDLQNLKPFFRSYTSTDFAHLSNRLIPRAAMADELESELEAFRLLNEEVDRLLPESESSAKQLSAMNTKNTAQSIHAVNYLRQYANECSATMLHLEAEKDVNSVVDQVIARNRILDAYLANRTLWVETAARAYEKHIMAGTLNESVWIAKRVGTHFLSSIVRCRSIHEMYTAAVALPCGTVLKPLSIMCFCIGWLLCCAVVLALVTMLGFCRSRVWLTGIGALKKVESALIGTELQENLKNGNNGNNNNNKRNSSKGSNNIRHSSADERKAFRQSKHADESVSEPNLSVVPECEEK